MKAEGIEKLVILPLYPQFSISTSGSALRVLERMLYTEPGFPMKSSVVPSWFNRQGYLQSTARRIADAVASLPDSADAHILYSAQGLPKAYIENMGDPYQEQVESTVKLLRHELEQLGVHNDGSLAYQVRRPPPPPPPQPPPPPPPPSAAPPSLPRGCRPLLTPPRSRARAVSARRACLGSSRRQPRPYSPSPMAARAPW